MHATPETPEDALGGVGLCQAHPCLHEATGKPLEQLTK